MSSLYLGTIGTKSNTVEVHAFTSGLPFREYPVSSVSDQVLFHNMLRGRFKIFEGGRSIFCTAVKPDTENRVESNPHDTRNGCIHIASIDSNGDIASAVSVAVDLGEEEDGNTIGLPLENRWRKQGFPEGQNMDRFRKDYPRLQWGRKEGVKPWEMAELYRHFKSKSPANKISCRLGLYTGLYHLLVREARKKQLTPTALWVFDAIPKYFNLYRYAGCAALRDSTISTHPEWISPGPKKINAGLDKNGNTVLLYKHNEVSRNVQVPVVQFRNGKPVFELSEIPFLDGVVDMLKMEAIGHDHPYLIFIKGLKGFSVSDRIKLFFGLNVIGRRSILNEGSGMKFISKWLNDLSCKYLQASVWRFNEIG